jgi:hypothetical protein
MASTIPHASNTRRLSRDNSRSPKRFDMMNVSTSGPIDILPMDNSNRTLDEYQRKALIIPKLSPILSKKGLYSTVEQRIQSSLSKSKINIMQKNTPKKVV